MITIQKVSEIFSSKDKKAAFFIVLFFAFNLLQQCGRREDYPFTYFGMYKEGRMNTKDFYRFKVHYIKGERKVDIASFKLNQYRLKRKVDTLLLKQTYSLDNHPLEPSSLIMEGRKEKIEKIFVTEVIPQLKKRNLSLKGAELSLSYEYWDELSPSNIYKPSVTEECHRIKISSLASKDHLNE
jgi:hypothetical protein